MANRLSVDIEINSTRFILHDFQSKPCFSGQTYLSSLKYFLRVIVKLNFNINYAEKLVNSSQQHHVYL